MKQGAIVLVPFPFTDLTGNKVLPRSGVDGYIAGCYAGIHNDSTAVAGINRCAAGSIYSEWPEEIIAHSAQQIGDD